MFSTGLKGVRYMEMAEGYVIKMALDEEGEVIGYQFVKVGKMLEDIRHGVSPDEATRTTLASTAVSTALPSTSTPEKNNSPHG